LSSSNQFKTHLSRKKHRENTHVSTLINYIDLSLPVIFSMSLPSENLETVLLSTFPAVPIALDSPRTYYKVVYDKLTPAGIIIALNDQLIVGTIL
jgi:hypothetical protein